MSSNLYEQLSSIICAAEYGALERKRQMRCISLLFYYIRDVSSILEGLYE